MSFGKDTLYINGQNEQQYAPFSYLQKKIENLHELSDLMKLGFVYSAYDCIESNEFNDWYEKQFSKKLPSKQAKDSAILELPNQRSIFESLEQVFQCYETLKKEHILINSKNLPIQLGEWYAKCIFGLKQVKSSSQRGFDFHLEDERIEIKVHWADQSSPKGVKIRKSLINLAGLCIVIYISTNFMIRDICILDSDFVIRKFTGKGHTIFLKDSEISSYFFSKSSKHFDKVVNKTALMKFASPNLALKLEGRL